ncbi:tRNA(Ile)-lysidine synthase [Anatilimnocola aggregata]|uniref:tRNA(Ile)-lysidine synthase n=1 Tax=Anatilimnocola aggregata TaxID=2528021 RepID=A0A517YN18_9BACT|nr:tRNA lysidine(34) synthetase TilS [Anatilimnocola aggregata]QDU31615.1 tRNA(Ile)-lysidine synthase [Anatilimnocola aggregata]
MLNQLTTSWPVSEWRDVTVLVAVSGGADSVALLCGLHELRSHEHEAKGKLIVGHFNHRLRETADHDADFVKDLAADLQLPCEIGRAEEPLSATGGEGLEATARAARYEFLLRAAEKVGARYVVTAHTCDDQAETILHRVIRGTGLAGLAGIQRARPLSEAVTVIRPLLEVCRAEVVAYLSDRSQTFCLDESNEDLSFTRNRIRHALLPQVAAQYNPNVREALLRLAQLAGDAQQVIESRARELVEQAVHIKSTGEVRLDTRPLQGQPMHLVRELLIQVWKQQNWPLQQMGLDEWSNLATLVVGPGTMSNSATSSLNLPGSLRASKEAEQVTLLRLKSV